MNQPYCLRSSSSSSSFQPGQSHPIHSPYPISTAPHLLLPPQYTTTSPLFDKDDDEYCKGVPNNTNDHPGDEGENKEN